MSLNQRTYEEKRDFIRMTLNASAKLTVKDSGEQINVTCIDLSAGGMSIQASQPIAVESIIHVNIESPNEQFKSMAADGRVLRCQELSVGQYDLGIAIESIS